MIMKKNITNDDMDQTTRKKNNYVLLLISLFLLIGCEDPTPTIEEIKNELIGKSIPGWNFDYLSEFKNIELQNKIIGTNRIEYDIKMDLVDERNNEKIEIIARVIYTKETENNWEFDKVELRNRTYVYIAPVDEWLNIYTLDGCSYTFPKDNQKFWLYDNCQEKKIELGGNNHNEKWIGSCDIIQIKSREKDQVSVKITYSQNVIR